MKRLTKESHYLSDVCEATPLVYDARLVLLECIRPCTGGASQDFYLTLKDVASDCLLARFAKGYGLASAIVHQEEWYVFASRWENDTWNDVTLFHSRDLQQWEQHVVLRQEPDEHIFNTSVCAADGRFVMAYETDDQRYVPFTIKFAASTDLVVWTPLRDALFAPERYAACPALRWVDGWFFMLYLEHKSPEWRFETYAARSQDLKTWEVSPHNPILAPGEGEDINTSDPDLVELEGKTYMYYSIGDQRTYSKLKRAVFDGTLCDFFRWCFR